MIPKKRLFTALLLVAPALVWANPENPHTPDKETTGTVAAIENVDNYTYVQIAAQGATNWYAVPSHAYTIGEEVVVPKGGLPMKDFYSESLDRTFDMVYFAGAIKQVGAAEETLPAGHPPISEVQPATPETFDFSEIERPADGKTIEEVYAAKNELEGETVVLRGIAVKVNNGILGRNWVHLRDGSGEKGADDLLVTTTQEIGIGQTITVTGKVLLNQDFGAGYQYDVLLEATDILSE